MAHDLDFMGESEALVAAIGTPRRLLRNNPLMLPRPLRAAELDVEVRVPAQRPDGPTSRHVPHHERAVARTGRDAAVRQDRDEIDLRP